MDSLLHPMPISLTDRASLRADRPATAYNATSFFQAETWQMASGSRCMPPHDRPVPELSLHR